MIERFNQTVIEAKRLLESKEFGKLLKVSTRRIGPPPGRDMGVGVLLDLGIHDLDLMQWITGEKLITRQSDFITRVVSPYDDLALVSGRLPSGALWHSEVSWLSPTKKRGLDLLFVSGAVSLDLLTGDGAQLQFDVDCHDTTPCVSTFACAAMGHSRHREKV
jgi:predicted dehydrogenase